METRKYILDKFQTHVHNRYEHFCDKHGIPKSDDQLLTFLIDQNLIPTNLLQHFTVRCEYETLASDRGFPKTQAVALLSQRFSLAERTVWNILKAQAPQKTLPKK